MLKTSRFRERKIERRFRRRRNQATNKQQLVNPPGTKLLRKVLRARCRRMGVPVGRLATLEDRNAARELLKHSRIYGNA